MPIQLDIKSPARSLNKAYLKENAGRRSEKCKQQLLHRLEKADPASSCKYPIIQTVVNLI